MSEVLEFSVRCRVHVSEGSLIKSNLPVIEHRLQGSLEEWMDGAGEVLSVHASEPVALEAPKSQ